MKLSISTFDLTVKSATADTVADNRRSAMIDAYVADGITSKLILADTKKAPNEDYDAELTESINLAFVTGWGKNELVLYTADHASLTPARRERRNELTRRLGSYRGSLRRDLDNRAAKAKEEKEEKEFLERVNGYKTEAAKKRAINLRSAKKAEAKKARTTKPAQSAEAEVIEYLTATYNVLKKKDFAIIFNREDVLEQVNELLAIFEA